MLVNFKRDFFGPGGEYYERGTREYNGPVEDEKGNPLLPRDAVVVSEDGHLPFQRRSPLPKPGFGAKPLEEQVLDMIPGAGDDHQIHSADPGAQPAPLTEDEKKERQAASDEGRKVEKNEVETKAEEELTESVETALPLAEAAAEKVKEIVDPIADLNLGSDKPKAKK